MKLLDLNEVLAAIRVSRATLYRLVDRGELPQPLKLGHRIFWPKSDLDRCLDRKERARHKPQLRRKAA